MLSIARLASANIQLDMAVLHSHTRAEKSARHGRACRLTPGRPAASALQGGGRVRPPRAARLRLPAAQGVGVLLHALRQHGGEPDDRALRGQQDRTARAEGAVPSDLMITCWDCTTGRCGMARLLIGLGALQAALLCLSTSRCRLLASTERLAAGCVRSWSVPRLAGATATALPSDASTASQI